MTAKMCMLINRRKLVYTCEQKVIFTVCCSMFFCVSHSHLYNNDVIYRVKLSIYAFTSFVADISSRVCLVHRIASADVDTELKCLAIVVFNNFVWEKLVYVLHSRFELDLHWFLRVLQCSGCDTDPPP